MSNLRAIFGQSTKSMTLLMTIAIFSSLSANACIHVYPLNANRFFADAEIVALAQVNSVTLGRPQGRSELTATTLVCFKGCTVDSELRVLVEGCDPEPPGVVGKPMVIFGRRAGDLLKAIHQDAVWVGPAIDMLGARPNRAAGGIGVESLQLVLASLIVGSEPRIATDALTWLGAFHDLPAEVRTSIRQLAVDEGEPLAQRVAALAALMRQPAADEVAIAAGMLLRNESALREIVTLPWYEPCLGR